MNRRFSAVVWALLLASLGLAGGCSDSPDRQAGKNLRGEVAESQRHFAAALELLGNPSYSNPAGKIVSRSEVNQAVKQGEANDLKALPPGAINPGALKHLEEAIRAVDQAIAANGEAPAPDMSGALSQAGGVHELLGFCYAWDASGNRGLIQDLLTKAGREVSVLQVQAASLKYFASFQSAAASEASALAESSRKQAGEKAAKLKDLDAEIASLEDKAKKLQEGSQSLTKEAGSLRLESKSASGKTALDLSEQSVQKQEGANKLASDLAGVEDTLRNRRMDREFLAAEEDLAKSLTTVGESAVQSRADLAAKMLEKKNLIVAAIDASQKKLDALAGQMADMAKQVRQSEEKAAAEFTQASRRLEAARTVLGSESPQAMINAATSRAKVCIAQARLLRASLALRADLDAFVARMQGLWPQLERPNQLPDLYPKLGADYLPDPKAVKKAAEDLCLDAVDYYRKYVIQQTKPELRWSPQALMGASYLCLYEISKDPANLKEAVASLDESVKDKENSPYLVDAMELDRLAHRLQEGPQTPAPAPTPAPASGT